MRTGGSSYSHGFPGGSDGKESACNAGDRGLIPRSGRSPGGGTGDPLPWRAAVHGMAKSQTRLSN